MVSLKDLDKSTRETADQIRRESMGKPYYTEAQAQNRNPAYMAYYDFAKAQSPQIAVMSVHDWMAEGSPDPLVWFGNRLEARVREKIDEKGNVIEPTPKRVKLTDEEKATIAADKAKDREARKAEKQTAKATKPARQPRQPRSNVLVAPASLGKKRLPQMFAEGIIKTGDVLSIANKADSSVTVIDGRLVRFNDKTLTFNAWGEQVTGHSAVNIYIHALTAEGKFLNELRG